MCIIAGLFIKINPQVYGVDGTLLYPEYKKLSEVAALFKESMNVGKKASFASVKSPTILRFSFFLKEKRISAPVANNI
jgi:hypothetical protein